MATRKKRLSPFAAAALTDEQRLERRRANQRRAQDRYRKKHSKAERRALRRADEARCYDWERVLPLIDKQPDGCWLWRGSFQVAYEKVRPIIRAGGWGKQYADQVVWCLHHQKPLPHACYLVKRCERSDCVSPTCMVLTNHPVENAKRRLRNGQKELRAVPRGDESGDDGRSRASG